MLIALSLFTLGSALCGAAKNMSWLIASRGISSIVGPSTQTEYMLGSFAAIQGAGGGLIQSITSIIISDLVPLRERGLYNASIGL